MKVKTQLKAGMSCPTGYMLEANASGTGASCRTSADCQHADDICHKPSGSGQGMCCHNMTA